MNTDMLQLPVGAVATFARKSMSAQALPEEDGKLKRVARKGCKSISKDDLQVGGRENWPVLAQTSFLHQHIMLVWLQLNKR